MEEMNFDDFNTVKRDCTVLFEKRTKKKLTQQEVADFAGISLLEYKRFENGESSFSSSNMNIGVAICLILDMDPGYFRVHFVINN